MVKYSRAPAEPSKTAMSRVDDLRAHYKNTYETAKAVNGMMLKKAINYYEAVLDHRQCIPFYRYTRHIGRTAQAKLFKRSQGRWPEKSVRHMHSLLKNLASNCEAKGLDLERCYVSHVVVQRAVAGRRRTFRAHGRITPYLSSNCHVEFFATEKAEGVKRADDKKAVRLTKRQAAQTRLAVGGGHE